MAEAEKKTVTVTKPVEEERVVLSLTTEEAEVLYYLTRRVSGDRSGPRGLFDNIGGALQRLGVDPRASRGLTTCPAFPASWQ